MKHAIHLILQVRVQLAKIVSSALYILNLIGQTRSDVGEAHSSSRSLVETLENVIKQVCEHAKKFKVRVISLERVLNSYPFPHYL